MIKNIFTKRELQVLNELIESGLANEWSLVDAYVVFGLEKEYEERKKYFYKLKKVAHRIKKKLKAIEIEKGEK